MMKILHLGNILVASQMFGRYYGYHFSCCCRTGCCTQLCRSIKDGAVETYQGPSTPIDADEGPAINFCMHAGCILWHQLFPASLMYWLAVAVAAKGTLVADVVAADTVAGVAPCTMGTFGGKII